MSLFRRLARQGTCRARHLHRLTTSPSLSVDLIFRASHVIRLLHKENEELSMRIEGKGTGTIDSETSEIVLTTRMPPKEAVDNSETSDVDLNGSIADEEQGSENRSKHFEAGPPASDMSNAPDAGFESPWLTPLRHCPCCCKCMRNQFGLIQQQTPAARLLDGCGQPLGSLQQTPAARLLDLSTVQCSAGSSCLGNVGLMAAPMMNKVVDNPTHYFEGQQQFSRPFL